MFFQQFKVEGLGCYSYLIGCPAQGEACVVDPERHVGQYLEAAQQNGLAITAVFDTHLHADHISGAAELAARTGAPVYLHAAVGAAYPHETLRDGQRFAFGAADLEVLETPGHTPNSVSFAVTDHVRADEVFALLTGDLLFVGDIGRPDLAGQDLLQDQVRNLYENLYKKLTRFPDWTEVYPAHGEGSLCGRGMSAKPMTTLGFERRHNPMLKGLPFDEFRRNMTERFQVRPSNFAAIVEKNRRGPQLLSELSAFTELSVRQVEQSIEKGARIVDTRPSTGFGAAFIGGAINIGMSANSVNWLGMVQDADTDLVVVAESPRDAHRAAEMYHRAGYDRLVGYLGDGVAGWASQGKPLDHLPQLSAVSLAHVLKRYPDHVALDVRTEEEWESGHIKGATHLPIAELAQAEVDLPKERHITTVCRSGYRSNIAGSLLKSRGYEHVFSLIGGMNAWNATRRSEA